MSWHCPICDRKVENGQNVCHACGLDRGTALVIQTDGDRVAGTVVHRCPICEAEVDEIAQICDRCKADMDIDVDGLSACPACGSFVPEESVICPECGVDPTLIDGPDACKRCGGVASTGSDLCERCLSDPDDVALDELRSKYESQTTLIDELLNRSEEKGLPVLVAKRKYEGATLMVKAGAWVDACEVLNECEEYLNSNLMQFDMLISTMGRSRGKILKAARAGVDITHAKLLMEKAESCKERFDMRKALSLAIESGIEAERSLETARSWNVEIAAFMPKR